jgi:hypothetical protein
MGDTGFDFPAFLDDYLFRLPYFPFYFTVHCAILCAVIRRHATSLLPSHSFLLGFFMAFLGRFLCAVLCGGLDRFLDHVLEIPIYALTWLLLNCSPSDLLYRFLNKPYSIFVSRLLYCVIEIRGVCQGVDTGRSAFGSATGSVLLAVLLSSSESFIWLLFWPETRMLADRVVRRNFAIGLVYLVVCKKWELQVGQLVFKMCALSFVIVVLIADAAVYGVGQGRGIDVTLMEYLAPFLTYSGGELA